VVGDNSSAVLKGVGALFPTTCMASMVKVIIGFEANDQGVNLSNLDRDYKQFTMMGGYIIQIINFLWLTLLGLYLEQVLPKEFGKQ
jgi:hypothetical protein